MSGFKDDVIAILRDNVLLHAEAIGLVLGNEYAEARELLKDLQDRKFPVTDHSDKHVFMFDYVVIHGGRNYSNELVRALSLVSRLGIIIVDIGDEVREWKKEYKSLFGDFTARKLVYQDRAYMVFTNGADYGN